MPMMIEKFNYNIQSARILFGSGRIKELADEVSGLRCRKALVLTKPRQADIGEAALTHLGNLGGGLHPEAVMHTPVEVTEKAVAVAKNKGADCLVAVGGGSTIGLAKAIALRTGLPQIAVPTTYAGSEVTPVLGETKDGLKTTRRSADILPKVVIYDVEQTLRLNPSISASSGLNAVAHAVEALYAKDANPVISIMAETGITALASSLPVITEQPTHLQARTEALYGAWLCGTCLGTVGMALHHKLCHVLAGTFNLPHSETHSILLPHSMAYNAQAAPQAASRVAKALGKSDAAQGLYDLLKKLKIPIALSEIGMPEDGLQRAVALSFQQSYWNPRPLEEAPLKRLLENAFQGAAP